MIVTVPAAVLKRFENYGAQVVHRMHIFFYDPWLWTCFINYFGIDSKQIRVVKEARVVLWICRAFI